MDKGNWWSYFFKDRVKALDELNLFYRRKWNSINWMGKVYDEDLAPKDKWSKTLKILNDIATDNTYPYRILYRNVPIEEDSDNWHNVLFTKSEIEKELLNVFKNYPKYSAHTEEGIKNDELYKSMVALMGFMQDTGAYYGVLRVGHYIDDDVVEAYVMSDKDRYNSIMSNLLLKYDNVFSKLYDIDNLDSDIDAILNLEDKDEMKRKIKELVLSNCTAIFNKDNSTISDLKDGVVKFIRDFKRDNKEVFELASLIGDSDETSSEYYLNKLQRYIDNK
jgi:hypothetical protein|nr:MAG TPA: hypothetical protein [Caudoviricetes sp.]